VQFSDDQKTGKNGLLDPNRAKLVEEARLWLLAMKVPQTPMHPITIINALESTWDKIEKGS
jgi:hypothetical protein